MAVDFMRSCFIGKWRLFQDDVGAYTIGRHYFCPPGTPHVPFTHFFGSRVWYDSNSAHEVSLGESRLYPHRWSNGEPPAVLPENFVVGSQACLEGGELSTGAPSETFFQDGYPPACFVPLTPVQTVWDKVGSYGIPCLQFFYATMVKWVYDHDVASINQVWLNFIGPDAVVTYYPGGVLLPDICTVVHPDFSVCIIDGTTNFYQLAFQAFDGLKAPQDFGNFGTASIWYTAGSETIAALTASGFNVQKPVLFCGHSYGAVAAVIGCATLKKLRPAVDYRYITFGLPKPGDDRLHGLLASCAGIALNNNDDPVTMVPPDYVTFSSIVPLLPDPRYFFWPAWFQAPNPACMFDDGHLEMNVIPRPDTATLLDWASKAINNIPQIPTVTHTIGEYIRRISLRGNCDCWPLNPEICKTLKQSEVGLDIGTTIVRVGLNVGPTLPTPPGPNVGLSIGNRGTPQRIGLRVGSEKFTPRIPPTFNGTRTNGPFTSGDFFWATPTPWTYLVRLTNAHSLIAPTLSSDALGLLTPINFASASVGVDRAWIQTYLFTDGGGMQHFHYTNDFGAESLYYFYESWMTDQDVHNQLTSAGFSQTITTGVPTTVARAVAAGIVLVYSPGTGPATEPVGWTNIPVGPNNIAVGPNRWNVDVDFLDLFAIGIYSATWTNPSVLVYAATMDVLKN